jgi:Raf kinase inhibitor-like YbhB/YbcL family protein
MGRWITFVFVCVMAAALTSCWRRAEPAPAEKESAKMSIILTSSAFVEGGPIPSRYTCDGADVSPPLSWSGVPAHAKSLALICEDPDAPSGTWSHWVLYNLPPTLTALPEGVAKTAVTADNARQGSNDFRRLGYGGPCPPAGKPHRYFFILYALDAPLALEAGRTRADLLRAMHGHILAEGRLMGTYQRSR